MIADLPYPMDCAPAGVSRFFSGDATANNFRNYLAEGSASAVRRPEDLKLDQLLRLPHNWDGNGSPPPSAAAVESARDWLNPLRSVVWGTGSFWRAPHITVGDEHDVTFEWWRRERKITLTFVGGTPEYLKVWGAHIENEMAGGPLQSTNAFRQLWLWLNAA